MVFTLQNGYERQRPGLGKRDSGPPARRTEDPALGQGDLSPFRPSSRIGFRRSRTPPLPRKRRGAPGAGSPDRLHTRATRPPSAVQPSRATPPPVSVPRSSTARMSSSSAGSPKPGVLLPLRGSSSCVTGDPAGLNLAKPPPRRPEWTGERLSGLAGVGGSTARMPATQSARGPLTGGFSSPRRSVEDHVRSGRRPRRGGAGPPPRRRGSGGWSAPQARRSCGGPETRGSEGARPPASLRRGRTECGPKEYAA